MAALGDRTVREVFGQAASTAPAPGAGSVTALAGAWGAALALKAIRISRRHDLAPPEASAAEPELERLAGLMLQDAEDDAAAFQAYVAALRRARSDPGRQAAISQAGAAAAETAVRALEHARAALELCRSLQGRIAPVVAADLEAGSALIAAAARTAGEDAVQNLAEVRSAAVRRQVLGRLEALGPGAVLSGSPDSPARP